MDCRWSEMGGHTTGFTYSAVDCCHRLDSDFLFPFPVQPQTSALGQPHNRRSTHV